MLKTSGNNCGKLQFFLGLRGWG